MVRTLVPDIAKLRWLKDPVSNVQMVSIVPLQTQCFLYWMGSS